MLEVLPLLSHFIFHMSHQYTFITQENQMINLSNKIIQQIYKINLYKLIALTHISNNQLENVINEKVPFIMGKT